MDTPVVQPKVTFKMLIFVRDVIEELIEKKNINCKKIKIMNDYINILIPILNKNLNSQKIVTPLITLNKIYNNNIGNRTVCNIIKRHILSNLQIYKKLISDLTEYIGLFIKGIEMFDDDASAIDERMRLSRENAKHISQLPEVAAFVHCHGLCTLEPLSKKQKTEEEEEEDAEEEEEEEDAEEEEEADEEEDAEEEEEADEEEEEEDAEEEEEEDAEEEEEADEEDEEEYDEEKDKDADKLLEQGFEPFEPGIRCFKFTSAPLCMTENSSSAQDKYIAEFFLILDEYYKSITLSDKNPDGESIFTNNINSIIVANYFICKFYKGYTCNMYKHVALKFQTDTENGVPIIEEYDNAICNASNRGFLYTYPIGNAASYVYLPYINESGQSLCTLLPTHDEDRSSAPHPSRVTVSKPGHIDKKIQRNKIYSVEDTPGPASLDIIILTSFKFNFAGDEISVAAGESLLALLLTLNTKYTAEMRKMIGLYQGRYGTRSTEGTHAYNFNESKSFSNISKGPKTTITSTSLRFLLFFFEKIGAKKATIFDFSCGVLDFTPEGEEQPIEVVDQLQKTATQDTPDLSQVLSQDSSPDLSQVLSQEMEASVETKKSRIIPLTEAERALASISVIGDKRGRGGMSPIFTKAKAYTKNTQRQKIKSRNKNKTTRRNKTNRKTKRRKTKGRNK